MKWEYMKLNLSKKEIEHNFNNYVRHRLSGADNDETYGNFKNNVIKFYKKKSPRSIRILNNYYIYGEIDDFGNLKYKYKKAIDSVIFTIFAPIFMLIFGALLGGCILGIEAMFIWLIPAVILLLCNAFKNIKLRKELLSAMLSALLEKDSL